MRWADERWVKLYTRETLDWLAMPWEARALFHELLKTVDRAGMLALGKSGHMGLALAVHMPPAVVETALAALVSDGCVEANGPALVLRNFIEAQEARSTPAAKKRAERERARARARGITDDVTPSHPESPEVASTSPSRRDVEEKREEQDQHPLSAVPTWVVLPERLVSLWNEVIAGMAIPAAVGVTEVRRRHLKARQRPERDETWWRAYFTRIAAAPLCRGDLTNWRADFGWAVKSEENVLKVLEGKYDAHEVPDAQRKAATPSYFKPWVDAEKQRA